ncbi:MAG: hypothetical protein R3Y04_07415 [Rikenellaceae bacterium]
MKSVIKVLFIVLIFVSCQHDSTKNEYNRLISSTIIISNSLESYIKGVKQLDSKNDERCMKLVSYINHNRCNSCVISKLSDWNKIIAYSHIFKGKLKIYFILSPPSDELNSVLLSLKSSSFDYPVVIDKRNEFKKLNPQIPDNTKLNTFLLDENNKVVMIGDPRNSSKLYSLFKTIVENNIMYK